MNTKQKLLALGIMSLSTIALAQAEPPELTRLRATYVQKTSEAVRPIQQQYLRDLDRLGNALMSRRDLEGALAVRKEKETLGGSQTSSPTPGTSCQFLAEMHEKNVKVGYGEFTTEDAVKVNGVNYMKALFAHAPSRVQYSLRGKGYSVLRGKAGLRDGSSSDSVEFIIIGDDKVLWRESLAGNKRTLEYSVPILGIQEIELQISDMGDKTADWSAWLDPQVCK